MMGAVGLRTACGERLAPTLRGSGLLGGPTGEGVESSAHLSLKAKSRPVYTDSTQHFSRY